MLMKKAADILSPYLSLSPAELLFKLEYPREKEMADVCLPCFAFAKQMRRPPHTISEELAEKINNSESSIRAQAAAGYLNLFFEADVWKSEIVEIARRQNYGHSNVGQGQRVVIDMSSPNIAKPLGIGHLRSTMIGNALVNLYRSAGYEVISVNHLGDWGTQFGKLIVAYRRWGSRSRLEQEPIQESLRLYVRFHEEAETEPGLENEAREAFHTLELGDPESRELWQYFVKESMKEFDRMYSRLGVNFDLYLGESFYNDKIGTVVDQLKQLNLLEESDGAQVVRLDELQIPPCMILKNDGSTIYGARDLTTAIYRKETMHADRILYVVGAEQSLHFKQVFSVLGRMGMEWWKTCHHVPFGLMTVNGKKMSTRKGKVVFLEDVLDEAVQRAEQIIEDKNPALVNKKEVAETVGVGAVIFNDLKHHRLLSVDFNVDAAVSFDGETGPYLQYTYARIRSLLRKGNFETLSENLVVEGKYISSDSAWDCIKTLSRYEAIIQEAVRENEPFVVARFLLDLAKQFNRYYNSEKVIVSDADETFAKLSLSAAVANVLKHGLSLLGVKTLEEM